MTFSTQLPIYIVDTLKCFGELGTVVDRILDTFNAQGMLIAELPPCPTSGATTRVTFEVTNEDYLTLVETYPRNSSKVSLKRLLTWFVENEMYDEWGWEVENEYVNSAKAAKIKKLNKIISDLNVLLRLLNDDEKEIVKNVIKTLKEIK